MYSALRPVDHVRRASQHENSRPFLHEPPQSQRPTQHLHAIPSQAAPYITSQDSPIPHRTQQPYYQPPPSSRTQGYNLPGVRDILNSDPDSIPRAPFTSSLTFPTERRDAAYSDGPSKPISGHPSTTFQPPTYSSQGPHASLSRPHEAIGLDARRHSLATLRSPYEVHPPGRGEQADFASKQTHVVIASSHASVGAPSPFRETFSDEVRAGQLGNTRPRQSQDVQSPAVPENHGQFLRVEVHPTDGEVYLYEDGHTIPVRVEGELVNPNWGLTKANKPRKRLAMACLDCREKKIKCEPGKDSCVQCQKATRICRRAPDKLLQVEGTASTVRSSPIHTSAESTPLISGRNAQYDGPNKRRGRIDSSHPAEAGKRHRSPSERSGSLLNPHERGGDLSWPGKLDVMEDARPSSFAWDNDPFDVDHQTTVYLLDLYFTHINAGSFHVFSRKPFLEWAKYQRNKCQNEKMVIYAMLAAGSLFADDSFSSVGRQFAQIASDAIRQEVGRFNVARALTGLFLNIYYGAKSFANKASEYFGIAVNVVNQMKLRTEAGCTNDAVSREQKRFEFSFTPAMLVECKRRTFWACFMNDRYGGGPHCMPRPEDIFLRLPCNDFAYEQSYGSGPAYLANGIIDTKAGPHFSRLQTGTMGWLVSIVAIWGDVNDFIVRSSYQSDEVYKEAYESFYASVQDRAADWETGLHESLRYGPFNLERSIRDGYAGLYILVHTMYHVSMMKLNRYMRHAAIPDSVGRNIRTANHHGHEILRIMTSFDLARKGTGETKPMNFAFATPFPGYAISSAVDTVSAGGLDSNLKSTLEEMDGAICCLRDLAKTWYSCEQQLKDCETRLYQLKNVTLAPKKAKSGCWLGRKWGLQSPLEEEFGPDNDCIYGLGEQEAKYFDAFKGT